MPFIPKGGVPNGTLLLPVLIKIYVMMNQLPPTEHKSRAHISSKEIIDETKNKFSQPGNELKSSCSNVELVTTKPRKQNASNVE